MTIVVRWVVNLAFVGLLLISMRCGAVDSPHKWRNFVEVDGQPLPVPREWVSTSAGRFAHSLKIPNPIPKTSGYKVTMGARQYYEHLCRSEAGNFMFKSAIDVEGFYFARPPHAPSDSDLRDRYKLEAAQLEAFFQVIDDKPEERATIFVNPPRANFRFVEEDALDRKMGDGFLRMSGYQAPRDPVTGRFVITPMKKVKSELLTSRFGLTWRGIVRPRDRQHGISGAEWIIYEIGNNRILGVSRSYGLSPNASTPQKVWWLNADVCPKISRIPTIVSNMEDLYRFVSEVLRPKGG